VANELNRAKKKLVAVRRAERRLQVALENIDWEFDVLMPEVEKLGVTAAELLELPEFVIEEEDEN
jgi:hypothetical protein